MDLPLVVLKQDWNSDEDLADWFKQMGVEYHDGENNTYVVTKLPEGWRWVKPKDFDNVDLPEIWVNSQVLADYDPEDFSFCVY
jgi:hypothetical protein